MSINKGPLKRQYTLTTLTAHSLSGIQGYHHLCLHQHKEKKNCPIITQWLLSVTWLISLRNNFIPSLSTALIFTQKYFSDLPQWPVIQFGLAVFHKYYSLFCDVLLVSLPLSSWLKCRQIWFLPPVPKGACQALYHWLL